MTKEDDEGYASDLISYIRVPVTINLSSSGRARHAAQPTCINANHDRGMFYRSIFSAPWFGASLIAIRKCSIVSLSPSLSLSFFLPEQSLNYCNKIHLDRTSTSCFVTWRYKPFSAKCIYLGNYSSQGIVNLTINRLEIREMFGIT